MHFARPNGWQVVTNFGSEPFALPVAGSILLSSAPLIDGALPGEATVWMLAD